MRLNYIDNIDCIEDEETPAEEPGKAEKAFQAISAQASDEDEEDWLL